MLWRKRRQVNEGCGVEGCGVGSLRTLLVNIAMLRFSTAKALDCPRKQTSEGRRAQAQLPRRGTSITVLESSQFGVGHRCSAEAKFHLRLVATTRWVSEAGKRGGLQMWQPRIYLRLLAWCSFGLSERA
jgi:hypothetical protein